MVTGSVHCLCFAYRNEIPKYTLILALTIYLVTMNRRMSPWGGIILYRLVVPVWFRADISLKTKDMQERIS